MAILSRADLKTFFETTDEPTEGQFADLIDSMINILDDQGGNPADLQFVKISIPTAQVLTLNSSPIIVVPAPGAGFAVQVVSTSYHVLFNTTAYATNTQLRLITDTANSAQSDLPGALNKTVDAWSAMPFTTVFGATLFSIVEDKALQATVASGDPTAGDSDIDMFITYKILTV